MFRWSNGCLLNILIPFKINYEKKGVILFQKNVSNQDHIQPPNNDASRTLTKGINAVSGRCSYQAKQDTQRKEIL